MKPITKLHYITTDASLAEQACRGGADWIQLRLKNVAYADFKSVAKEVQAVCKQYGATFIVNDNVKLALDIDADGVHVGKSDPLLPEDIDEILARDIIIGCSTNTIDDFVHLAGKAVSYVGLGPFRYTTTKQNLNPILGIVGYRTIFSQLKDREITPPPVIGIGGIVGTDVPALLATGLYGVAVSGAISGADDVVAATKRFREIITN